MIMGSPVGRRMKEGLLVCVFWIIRPVLIKNLDLIQITHAWVNLRKDQIPRLPRLPSALSQQRELGLVRPSCELSGGFGAGLRWDGRNRWFPPRRKSLQKWLAPLLAHLPDSYCCFLLTFILPKWTKGMGCRIYISDVSLLKIGFRASRVEAGPCWCRGRFWGRARLVDA